MHVRSDRQVVLASRRTVVLVCDSPRQGLGSGVGLGGLGGYGWVCVVLCALLC